MDCGFMKFLMLDMRACVNFVSIGMLVFFFRLLSIIDSSGGGRLRVDEGSTLMTLDEDGVIVSSF